LHVIIFAILNVEVNPFRLRWKKYWISKESRIF